MNKMQLYISAGVVILMLILLGGQYMEYQNQVTRHGNAVRFWSEEVPRVQAEYPEFQPQDIDQMLAEEMKLFEGQIRSIHTKSGLIILAGIAGLFAVYYVPRRK